MRAQIPLCTLVLLALLMGSAPADAEDAPQQGVGGAAQGKRPSPPPPLAYPGSRSSSTYIDSPDGTRVAVGEGREWQGVKVYLSLLWDVIGVDVKTGKALYKMHVGAFWNTIGFKEVTPKRGQKIWAIELSPGVRSRAPEKRQYHDLHSGKKLDVPSGVEAPSGKRFKPEHVWKGKHSRIPKAFHALVSTSENWATLQKRMFGLVEPKRFAPIDFAKQVVLVVSGGDSWNCKGIGVQSAYEDDARVLVRTNRGSFQTMNGAQQARPYGIFVLPKREKKAYVVQHNRQGLIGGPPLWTESWRLPKRLEAAAELRDLPAATDVKHDAWVK